MAIGIWRSVVSHVNAYITILRKLPCVARCAVIAAPFILTGVGETLAASHFVQVHTSYDGSKCLDILQGALQPNYGVDLFDCRSGDRHETFEFKQLVDGYYWIIPQNGGVLCLDTNETNPGLTTQLVQNVCADKPSQKWRVNENADGTFTILDRDGKRSIGVAGVRATANHSQIVVGPLADIAERKFVLIGFSDNNSVADGDRVIGPNYSFDPYLVSRSNVPKGRVITFAMDASENCAFWPQLQVLGASSRRIWIYIPRQYVKGQVIPFMVSQDAAYREELVTLLDNAIYDKKLPVMAIIFASSGGGAKGLGVGDVQGTERNLEYDTLSAHYGEWVQSELVPRVEAETKLQIPDQAVTLTSDPNGRGAIGCSSGATASFTMAWFLPDLFRRVISYSGSYTNFQYPTDPADPHGAWSYHEGLIKNSEVKPIRLWLEVGTQDMDLSKWGTYLDWQAANITMASALEKKGYHYHFDLAQGAHHCDTRVVRQTLAEAMQWLWKDYAAPLP